MRDIHIAQNYISGQWKQVDDRERFESINPANEEILGYGIASNVNDVNEAVQAAKDAYTSWRKTPAPQRAEFLWKVAEQLEQKKETIAKMMTLEMGKTYADSLGEVGATIASCKYMAGEGRRLFGETVPTGSQDRIAMTIREPLGVVACITPWNYPIALASYKIFSALITGNTIVWKPASDIALTASMFVEVLESAGLPLGVLNLILGSGSIVGNLLAEHEDVKVIAFTGSTEVGKQLAEIAARSLKRISLELGGKNAIIVLADADLDKAADGIVKSAFGMTGQRCTSASRVIVEASIQQQLEERLIWLTEKLRTGSGLDAEVNIGPLANQKQLATVERYVEIAKKGGGKILLGGHSKKEDHAKGYFYAPTIITDVLPEHRIAKEEIFGPVLAIITARDYEHAIEINNNTIYGLSSSIYTNSLHYANRAARDMESGLVYINNGTANAESGMAFGGMKQSGNGHREVSYYAFDVMTEWKTIYTNY